MNSFIGWCFQGLPECHVELGKVHIVAARPDRDKVTGADLSSVLDRFVGANSFDFFVDVVQQLTEAMATARN